MMFGMWEPDLSLMDPVRRRIAERILALRLQHPDEGFDLKTLSDECGMNGTYLWQFFHKNKPQELPEHARVTLSRRLGLDESELRGPRLAGAANTAPRKHLIATPSATGGRDLPEIGRPIMGSDSVRLEGGRVQKFIERPPYASDKQAFTVRVNGTTMANRFRPGERIYVDPSEPVKVGADVFVEMKDDTANIRELREIGPDFYILHQHAPGPKGKDTKVPFKAVARISVINARSIA